MGNYSSGDVASLPTDTADLEHIYDATDLSNVQTDDSNYVEQTATGEYPIHQYKDTITSANANITWKGKSDQAPSTYPVHLQIYKTAVPAGWETLKTNNVASAGVDFTLQELGKATADYKDGSNVVVCRVYQEFSAGGTATIGQGTVGGNPCTYTGFEDNWIYVSGPDVNYGGHAQLTLWSDGSNNKQITLIQIPGLSNLSGKTVTAATLYINFTTVSGSHDIYMRRILVSWVTGTDDGSLGFQVGSSDWNHRQHDTVAWNTAGALAVGTGFDGSYDVSSTTTLTQTVSATQVYALTSAQLISDINHMISNPSTNYGWQIYIPSATNQNDVMDSSQAATAGNRPYLDVTYTG